TSENATPGHAAFFLNGTMATQLVNTSFYAACNTSPCIDLYTSPVVTGAPGIFGVANSSTIGNDILSAATAAGGIIASQYPPCILPNGASVLQPVGANNYITLLDGWGLQSQTGRFCPNNKGRGNYLFKVLSNVFGSLCPAVGLQPVDVPGPG